MPAKRIVACLDVRGGRTVKGARFRDLRDAGDPVELATRYRDEGIDELVMLDVDATREGRLADLATVSAVAAAIDVPLTVGGGVRSIDDFERLLYAGADKVAVNSWAVARLDVIAEAASAFGSQCVVVAMDVRSVEAEAMIRVASASRATALRAIPWAQTAAGLGAGELLVTSIDRDGTSLGFDLGLTREIVGAVTIPVVASGGAASAASFVQVFLEAGADAALAASLFHSRATSVSALKRYLRAKGIEVRQ